VPSLRITGHLPDGDDEGRINNNVAFETTHGCGARIVAMGSAAHPTSPRRARRVRETGTPGGSDAGGWRHGRKLGEGGQARESLETDRESDDVNDTGLP